MPARLLAAVLLLALTVAGAAGCSDDARPRGTPVPVTVYLATDVTPEQKQAVEDTLRATPGVTELTYESREEAYRRFKEQFKDAPELVRSTRPGSLPASFRFKLADHAEFDTLAGRLRGMPGVADVLTVNPSLTPVRPSRT